MLKEFKAFISKGNVIDLAVGVIIGAAFGKIVSSLVNDILMPVIGIIFGGLDFEALSVTIGEASINYGLFIQSIVDFFIIALTIFLIVKLVGKLRKPKPEESAKAPEPSAEEKLLAEIRDLLKAKQDL